MEEWKTYTIGDIADVQTGPFGSQLHNEDYVIDGTPIVTVEHLGNRKFTTQNLPKVSATDKERLIKYVAHEGDIIFSRVGSVDRCSYVSAHEHGWLFSGRCLRVRPKECVDPLFLYYFFTQESTKQEIRNVAVGATMPSINTKLLSDITVSLPSLSEQKLISSILSAIDDKIELNNRINQKVLVGTYPEYSVTNDGIIPRSEKFNKQLSKSTSLNKVLKKHNLVFGMSRDILNWGIMLDDIGGVSSAYNIYEIDDTMVNPLYLKYYMKYHIRYFNDLIGTAAREGQSLDKGALMQKKALVPFANTISSFFEKESLLRGTIATNRLETSVLEILRDGILPHLMSGKLNINELDC